MKHFFFSPGYLFFFLFLSTAVSAQQKLGYINMDELIAAMPETSHAQQVFKAYADSLSRIDGALQQEFISKRDAFFQDSARMDTARKESERRALQKLIQEDGSFRAQARAQLDSVRQALTGTIAAKAQDALATVAKANGYGFVIRKAGDATDSKPGFLIISPEADDLLPLVKKQLGLGAQ